MVLRVGGEERKGEKKKSRGREVGREEKGNEVGREEE